MNSSCEDAAEKSTFWRHGLRGETCCFSLDFRHLLQVERKKILCYATTIAALHRSLNRRRPLPYNWTSTQNERTGNIPLTVKMWAFFSLTRTRSLIFSMETKNWKVSSSPYPTHSSLPPGEVRLNGSKFPFLSRRISFISFAMQNSWFHQTANLTEFDWIWKTLNSTVCVCRRSRPPTNSPYLLFISIWNVRKAVEEEERDGYLWKPYVTRGHSSSAATFQTTHALRQKEKKKL